MKNELLVFASIDHPLYSTLKENDLLTHELKPEGLDPVHERIFEIKYIFDFSLGREEDKERILTHLSGQFDVPIFSDLSCVNGERIMESFPGVKGAFSGNKEKNCCGAPSLPDITRDNCSLFLEVERIWIA